MMALNTGDLSFLEGLTEVKKELSPLGPWVMVLLHPAQEEFAFLSFSSVFGFFSWLFSEAHPYSLQVSCESQLASTGV